jgi:acid phosphatase
VQNTPLHFKILVALFFILTQVSCHSSNTLRHPTTSATLWIQNAAEYKALTTSVYKTALRHLQEAINDSSWTAVAGQTMDVSKGKPPAIIVDVDETVLDNSPFQARMIKQESSFSPEAWNDWVMEAQAEAVPGARSFLKKATQHGITVFYVTNREAKLEKGTRQNLEDLGFPVTANEDRIFSKYEQENWTSAKVNRRAKVAADYRILMLIGDNLNDFVSAKNFSQQERNELVKKYEAYWGKKWFILPNPTYGSWQDALLNSNEHLSESEEANRKLQQLDTKK